MAKPARLLKPQPVEVSIVKTCALHTFRLAPRLATASSAAPGYTRAVVREIAEAWRESRRCSRVASCVLGKQLGTRPTHVFSLRGRPIRQVSTKAWYQALVKAGIEDFGWHDLRHTWASWHVESGTPLYALQELGAWESPEVVRRYAHLTHRASCPVCGSP